MEEKVGGEMDMLMEPGENKFRSLRWDLNDLDPTDISCGNWGVWAFRGKRYEFCMIYLLNLSLADRKPDTKRRRGKSSRLSNYASPSMKPAPKLHQSLNSP